MFISIKLIPVHNEKLHRIRRPLPVPEHLINCNILELVQQVLSPNLCEQRDIVVRELLDLEVWRISLNIPKCAEDWSQESECFCSRFAVHLQHSWVVFSVRDWCQAMCVAFRFVDDAEDSWTGRASPQIFCRISSGRKRELRKDWGSFLWRSDCSIPVHGGE